MSAASPLVSVLLTVYNGERYLPAALASVLAQTYPHLELLVGLNGCTDGSAAIVSACTDARMRVWEEPRAGRCRMLNRLLQEAHGEVIAIQDADDEWQPDKLARQVPCLTQAEVVGTFITYRRAGQATPGPISAVTHAEIAARLRAGDNQLANSATLVRRDWACRVGGWCLDGCEDYDFWLRLLAAGARCHNVPEPLTRHRLHAASTFNNTPHQANARERVLAKHQLDGRRLRVALLTHDLAADSAQLARWAAAARQHFLRGHDVRLYAVTSAAAVPAGVTALPGAGTRTPDTAPGWGQLLADMATQGSLDYCFWLSPTMVLEHDVGAEVVGDSVSIWPPPAPGTTENDEVASSAFWGGRVDLMRPSVQALAAELAASPTTHAVATWLQRWQPRDHHDLPLLLLNSALVPYVPAATAGMAPAQGVAVVVQDATSTAPPRPIAAPLQAAAAPHTEPFTPAPRPASSAHHNTAALPSTPPCYLMLASEYPPARGYGLARYASDLAAALVANGATVHVVTLNHDAATPPDTLRDGVHVHDLRTVLPVHHYDWVGEAVLGNLRLTGRALEVARAHGPFTAIISHDWLTAQAAKALRSILRLPWLLLVHDTELGKRGAELTPHQRYISEVETWALAQADHLATTSQFLADELGTRYHIPPARLHVIGAAVDPRRFAAPANRDDFRRLFLPPGEHQLLVCAGRLSPTKGVEDLLAAFRLLLTDPRFASPAAPSAQSQSLHLIMAGDGVLASTLAEQAQQPPFAGRFHLPGHLSDPVLGALYRAADLVVLPSRYEPYGLVAREALTCGAPLLLTAVGGLAELAASCPLPLPPVPAHDPPALAAAIHRFLTQPTPVPTSASSPCPTWSSIATAITALLAPAKNRSRRS